MENSAEGFKQKIDNEPGQKESAIQRIVNLTENEEEDILEETRETFQNPEKLPIEREKTEKETQIIQDVLAQLGEFLREQGIESLNLTLDHIHVVVEASLSVEQKETFGVPEEAGGFYMEDQQGIVVFASDDDLKFAGRVAHECMHANSFVSFTAQDGKYAVRRTGLVVLDENGKRYFHNLNEGLTEELTKRFDRKYFDKMPSLSDAVKEREKFIAPKRSKNPSSNTDEIQSVRTIQEPDGEWETIIEEYVYPSEREELLSLVNTIYEKNKAEFTSPEDVFQLFVKAAFTGRILDIARLVESTFGKGAFTQLAEKTALKKK